MTPQWVFTGPDLHGLPGGTVVLAADKVAYQKDPEFGHWQSIGDPDPLTDAQFAEQVLHPHGGLLVWVGR